ncbi:hypothetical protein A33Q_1364 [Indibacter alkaliphilus LW1]|uniref:Uncharacterized protein n=1 Tax=Indibacter alkaliphilus (strain CCUG 57479 / KCTC 22604 / LW1) TaxID=1189612 RepID=S2DNA8_INDAL|nr:hypothetical protein [Indibacter alkaliphilus]EOZ98710.1 hypothetical protein A33Q_1364 [Indibacter alkaliphilus LW1]
MFEIDIPSMLIAIVAILAFIAPFYIQYLRVKKTKLRKTSELNRFLEEKKLQINDFDFWRNFYYVGIDSSQMKLVYAKGSDQFSNQLIDLKDINYAKISESFRILGEKEPKRKIIDLLILELIDASGNVRYMLEFYDGEKYSDLLGETVLVKEWRDQVNSVLKKNRGRNSNPLLAVV